MKKKWLENLAIVVGFLGLLTIVRARSLQQFKKL